jgi:hypothetical protein
MSETQELIELFSFKLLSDEACHADVSLLAKSSLHAVKFSSKPNSSNCNHIVQADAEDIEAQEQTDLSENSKVDNDTRVKNMTKLS